MKMFLLGIRSGAYAFVLALSLHPVDGSESEIRLWPRHVIDPSDKASGKLGADGVRLADADGDGDLDVVTGWENGDAIRVALNPGIAGSRKPWPAFSVGRVKGAEDAVFADLDADGVLDVVSCTEGKTRTVFVHWAPEAGSDYTRGESWTTEAIPVLQDRQMWMYCLPFDANGDGRDDLVLGSKNAGATVGWLEQPAENPRDLSGWTYHPLYEAGWIMSIRADDLDGDGDEDLLFSDRKGASTGVWWMENVGGESGKKGSVLREPKRLGLSGDEVMFIDVADVDGDGRHDVLAAVREREVVVLLQPESDPEAGWTERRFSFPVDAGAFSTGTSKAVKWFPEGGEGRWQFLLTCERADGEAHGVLLLRAAAGGETGDETVECAVFSLSGPEGVKYDRMELLDLDGDGDRDLMTCEERDDLGVFWHENPGPLR